MMENWFILMLIGFYGSVKIKFCHHCLRAFLTITFSQKEIAMGILAINFYFNMRADGKTKTIFARAIFYRNSTFISTASAVGYSSTIA